MISYFLNLTIENWKKKNSFFNQIKNKNERNSAADRVSVLLCSCNAASLSTQRNNIMQMIQTVRYIQQELKKKK